MLHLQGKRSGKFHYGLSFSATARKMVSCNNMPLHFHGALYFTIMLQLQHGQ